MDYSVLQKTPLFRNVAVGELERIFSELKVTASSFRRGEILAMQDEPANRLIVILSGSVKGEMTDAAGKVVKVEDVRAPSPLAILFLFGENNRFPVQATALEDVEAVVIPRQSVLRMLSVNETILENYLGISSDFASRLSRKLSFMSLNTIRQKLAVYILQLSKKAGSDSIVLDMTKSALAGYFGVARQSLERELSNMRDEGLISATGVNISIKDRKAIVDIAGG